MSKNLKESIIIIIVIAILLSFGFIIYQRYALKESKEIANNYYSAEYLFNNSYIEKPKDINYSKNNLSNIYMYLDKGNTLYIRNTSNNYSTQVLGLPKKTNIKVYYNTLSNNVIEISALDGNDLYYVKISQKQKKNNKYKFTKISTNVKDIYTITNSNDEISRFIINNTKDELKKITKENNKYIVTKSIEKTNPYLDYICFNKDYLTCEKTKVYITFYKELVINNKKLKDKNNKEITIKNIFGTINNLDKKEYDLKIYIITTADDIYILKDSKLNLYSTKKVEDIKFQEQDKIIKKVLLNYRNNSEEVLSNNDQIITSTIYDREKLSINNNISK